MLQGAHAYFLLYLRGAAYFANPKRKQPYNRPPGGLVVLVFILACHAVLGLVQFASESRHPYQLAMVSLVYAPAAACVMYVQLARGTLACAAALWCATTSRTHTL